MEAMSEDKARAEGYVDGYKDGLNEAWEELLSLTTKGYTSREIQILAKARRSAIQDKVEIKRKGMMKDVEFTAPIVEVPARDLPSPDAASASAAELEVRAGWLYIIEDKRLEQPISVLKQRQDAGERTLCILRSHPDNIKTKYGIDCSMIWLTKTESCPVDDCQRNQIEFVSPTELPRLNSLIKSFLSENRGGAILLEGLEYLITQNDFKSVLKFIQGVKDQVILTKGIFLVPFDPTVLDPKDLKALERETEG
jgi:hypothetical protein